MKKSTKYKNYHMWLNNNVKYTLTQRRQQLQQIGNKILTNIENNLWYSISQELQFHCYLNSWKIIAIISI